MLYVVIVGIVARIVYSYVLYKLGCKLGFWAVSTYYRYKDRHEG